MGFEKIGFFIWADRFNFTPFRSIGRSLPIRLLHRLNDGIEGPASAAAIGFYSADHADFLRFHREHS